MLKFKRPGFQRGAGCSSNWPCNVGPRWTIDSVLADRQKVQASPKNACLKHAALEPRGAVFAARVAGGSVSALPLECSRTATLPFTPGYISFQADTLEGATSKEGVTLHILCAPRDANVTTMHCGSHL